jgi:hypothetical protein
MTPGAGGIMKNKNKVILGILIIVGGLAVAACGTRTVVIPSAATPTVTVTPGSTSAPQATTTVPAPQAPAAPAAPAGTPASNYAQDIADAGIVAPPGWLASTGQRLCADWQNGESTDQTDQILLAGGIHPNHLAAFDSITNSDVCPGVTR